MPVLIDTHELLSGMTYDIATNMTLPRVVVGNFNMITDDMETLGGLPAQSMELISFII